MNDDGVDDAADEPVRLTAWVAGDVQGVGFRWWTRARALELGLAGWAMNRPDGRVEVVAEGSRPRLEALLSLLQPAASSLAQAAPRPGTVTGVVGAWSEAKELRPGFIER